MNCKTNEDVFMEYAPKLNPDELIKNMFDIKKTFGFCTGDAAGSLLFFYKQAKTSGTQMRSARFLYTIYLI